MNYFELFGITPSFILDEEELRQKYYEKSREYHPDRFGLLPQEEQIHALEMSTTINKAYRTLSSKRERIKYVLEINGIDFVEGSEKVPQEFLIEVMDINEMIMEFKMDPENDLKDDILKQLKRVDDELNEGIQSLFEEFNFQNKDEKQLLLIKDYYLKTKYIDRIVSNLDN
ncbi:MAG: Fe-S protein assembly co-chaperone HscB [Saprospiraceae bacterium]